MLCWSLPVPALQVSAAGVDLEAGKCGCRCVSVDICSFEDGVGYRDVGLRTVMHTPTRNLTIFVKSVHGYRHRQRMAIVSLEARCPGESARFTAAQSPVCGGAETSATRGGEPPGFTTVLRGQGGQVTYLAEGRASENCRV